MNLTDIVLTQTQKTYILYDMIYTEMPRWAKLICGNRIQNSSYDGGMCIDWEEE